MAFEGAAGKEKALKLDKAKVGKKAKSLKLAGLDPWIHRGLAQRVQMKIRYQHRTQQVSEMEGC